MTDLEKRIMEVEALRKDVLLPILTRDHGYEQRPVAGGKVKNTRTGIVEFSMPDRLEDSQRDLRSRSW